MLNLTGAALTVCLSLLLIPLAGSAGAATVYGTSDLFNGNIYIPLTQEASGSLGDHTPGGSPIGLVSDRCTLTTQYPTSSGYVSLMVDFDISDDLQPGESVGYDSDMSMWINFEDLDFNPVENRKRIYKEWVDIELLNELGERIAGADTFTLDEASYLTYRQDIVGGQPDVATDNVAATYGDILIRDIFFSGNTAGWESFVDSLNKTNEFGMLLTFNSELEMKGGRRLILTNSIEQLDSSQIIIENVAPEPASLSMLALGGLSMLARRKKRRQ